MLQQRQPQLLHGGVQLGDCELSARSSKRSDWSWGYATAVPAGAVLRLVLRPEGTCMVCFWFLVVFRGIVQQVMPVCQCNVPRSKEVGGRRTH